MYSIPQVARVLSCTRETQLPVSGNSGQVTELLFQLMMPVSLGVGLGVAAKELMTPLLGDSDRELTLPSTLSVSLATALTFLPKLGLHHGELGSLQHLLLEWLASWFGVFLQ